MKAIPAETVYFSVKHERHTPALIEEPSEKTLRIQITFPSLYPMIPDSFEQALNDVTEGRVIDLDQALNERAPEI